MTLVLLANGYLNYITISDKSHKFFDTTIGGVYIPALKVYLGGLTPKIMLKKNTLSSKNAHSNT